MAINQKYTTPGQGWMRSEFPLAIWYNDFMLLYELGGLSLSDLDMLCRAKKCFWLGLINAIRKKENEEMEKAKQGAKKKRGRGRR